MDSVPGTLMHALLLKDHAKARLRHALTTVSTSGFLEATNVPVTEPFQWLLPWNGTPFPFTSAVLLLLPYSSLILKLTFILNLFCLFLLYCCLRFVSFDKGALQMPYIIIIIIITSYLPKLRTFLAEIAYFSCPSYVLSADFCRSYVLSAGKHSRRNKAKLVGVVGPVLSEQRQFTNEI